MKKIILTFAVTAFFTNFVSAQHIGKLPCENTNPEIGKSHFIDIRKGGRGLLNLDVNWGGKNGGSTFGPGNLVIKNGAIQAGAKLVGQIGANNPKQTWVLKVTDLTKPVEISWIQPKGKTGMCANLVATVATKDFQ